MLRYQTSYMHRCRNSEFDSPFGRLAWPLDPATADLEFDSRCRAKRRKRNEKKSTMVQNIRLRPDRRLCGFSETSAGRFSPQGNLTSASHVLFVRWIMIIFGTLNLAATGLDSRESRHRPGRIGQRGNASWPCHSYRGPAHP